VIARPPGGARHVLATQTLGGAAAMERAERGISEPGTVSVSEQIASELGTRAGGELTLPTPSGDVRYKVAALTTNLAWSPGVIFMGNRDFARAWRIAAPSALAVYPGSGASPRRLVDEIRGVLPADAGVEVASAGRREARIDTLTNEGLSQLGIVSTLLVITAVLALAAAIASSIHQRRVALAGLRLAGAPPSRLRRILLVEAGLMLGAGCVTGALAGAYGQFVIDQWFRASRVPPSLALGEE
jgi:putative ABC transport system permease protein